MMIGKSVYEELLKSKQTIEAYPLGATIITSSEENFKSIRVVDFLINEWCRQWLNIYV